MAFSLHGVHLPHRKATARMAAVRVAAPKSVLLPTMMHIGRPAVPVVKAGDHVDVGTLVAEQDGLISSPVYASVSGTVKKITEIVLSGGAAVPAILIESDGAMTPDPALCPPVVGSRADLIEAIRKSGVVGLGGAGFPTYVKFLTEDPSRIRELIVNGAECEPYITSDTRAMLDESADMALAFRALEEHLGIPRILIGIENNKKEAIAQMRRLAEQDPRITVRPLRTLYPQGGEKVLIYHTTGKVVPAGKLPIDVGCVVSNCSTLAAIGRYLRTGMPLVERCITVDGSAVREPGNVIVPIGMAAGDVFEACGGFSAVPGKVLYGGPMMGVSVPDLAAPVLKNTNALLAFSEKDAAIPAPTACISCGACQNHCPFHLRPAAIARAYRNGDVKKLEKLQPELCMECGCCAYICPAGRPLVQTNKLAKAVLRDARAKEKEAAQ